MTAAAPVETWPPSPAIGVLRDVRDGTHSVLEHGCLVLVERPHGLPRARRQPAARGTLGLVHRDASYGDHAHVELDSRLFHDSTEQRDRDLDRDLDAVAVGGQTARLGWGQVFARPCVTAVRVVRFLRRIGVEVDAKACGPGCPVEALVRASARVSAAGRCHLVTVMRGAHVRAAT